MATYSVDGKQYSTSLLGLYIAHEYEKPGILGLESIDGDLTHYFENDPLFISKTERLIFLYSDEKNLNEPVSLAYSSWNPPDTNDSTGEIQVQLDDNDRKYLRALLTQYNSDKNC